MSFSQFLNILRARWKAALIVLFLTVGTTLLVSLLLPKQYTATAAVVVDVKTDPLLGTVLANTMNPSYIATQVDIISSDRVAQAVVRDLKLTDNPTLRADWMSDTNGVGNFEAWIANLLQTRLDVRPSHTSNVITIAYTAPDGKFAAALSNAFVAAYLRTSIDLRVAPAKEYSTFFDARARDLRNALETAQNKLSDYQRAHGLLVTDERLDIETQRLNELTSQSVTLQALSADTGSRSAQAKTAGNQLQDVINNPVVAGLRSDLTRQQARLKELSARLGDAHPQVVEIQANIRELSDRLDAESRRVSNSVNVNDAITKSRVAEVRGALDAQRAKVLKMKEQRDEAAVLLRDVEAAQRAYEAITGRATQTSLESQNNQSNISLLTQATEPPKHSSPRILLNTLVSVVVGVILAMTYCVIRELTDRRVRTVEDLIQLVDVPVLGQLPKPIGGNARSRANLVMPLNVLGRLPSPGR